MAGTWSTLDVAVTGRAWRVGLRRPDARPPARPGTGSALSMAMLGELSAVIDRAADQGVALLTLEGGRDEFCSGMDFRDVANLPEGQTSRGLHEAFAGTLRRLAGSPLVTVAVVEGAALGGGVGLAAACDRVIATPTARFALPEALWGLVPALAGLYLKRRIGAHRAAAMALTTEPVTARTAETYGLVDEIVADGPADGAVRRLSLRLGRLPAGSAAAVKALFHGGLPMDPADEARAVDAITGLTDRPALRAGLRRYLETGVAPWASPASTDGKEPNP
jgi:polyketide biosynthesis enoyl-CoA hydratase PksH